MARGCQDVGIILIERYASSVESAEKLQKSSLVAVMQIMSMVRTIEIILFFKFHLEQQIAMIFLPSKVKSFKIKYSEVSLQSKIKFVFIFCSTCQSFFSTLKITMIEKKGTCRKITFE